jgi:hypothetical protein
LITFVRADEAVLFTCKVLTVVPKSCSSKRKTLLYRLLAWALLAGLGLNFIYSAASVLISSLNYPGGQALK